MSPESAIKSGSARRRMRPFVFQCGQSNVEAAPLGGETGQRDAKRRRTREQSPHSIEYRKARCPAARGRTAVRGTGFPLASTQGGVHSPEVLRRADSRSAPRGAPCPGRS